MITLQQLLMTDPDLSGGTQTGKGAEGAQDFLSLLAGALTETAGQGQGKDAPLTLASLKAATSKLSKEAILKDGDSTLQTKLAALLARQDQLTAADTTQTAPLQGLMTSLLPATHGDALKALTGQAQKEESKTDLNDEELAGLSALMAMLPHQQTATAAVAPSTVAGEIATQPAGVTSSSSSRNTLLNDDLTLTSKVQASTRDTDRASLPASVQQLTPVVEAASAKQEVMSTVSPTTPTATLAPIVANNISAPPAGVAAPAAVISQPLGTHEWQQAISQHVTLYTKQGQQSAELHLHPEDLGQVQISLKLDDNQAQLQMVSAHSNVRAALEAALPMLRTQLAENGIQLAQSTISSESFAGQQQQSSQQQQQASRSGQQGGFNDESEELLATPAALQSAARGNSAVDIFA